jgi:acetylornithine deacetylase/succinyl-diaminopimelate desuccinylase-like protein
MKKLRKGKRENEIGKRREKMNFQIKEKELIQFARKLLQVPSPSGQEKEISKVVAAEMKAAGFERVKVDGLGNVVGVVSC